MILDDGIYTALGTPVDSDGRVLGESLTGQIEKQLDAGVSGMLIMGSMGMQAAIKNCEYSKVAKVASEAVKGRVPLFVGAMDNSVMRVKARIDELGGYDIHGVVLTTPFYHTAPAGELINFFLMSANESPFPIYLYDLPVVTKQKITYEIIREAAKHPNIKGIKTGDMALVRKLKHEMPEFEAMYSNLDTFDAAVSYGINKVLDGMFSCTPANTALMLKNLWGGSMQKASECLNNILGLRDKMAEFEIFPSFTAAMNLLGFEGCFGPDYMGQLDAEGIEAIRSKMVEIGEL